MSVVPPPSGWITSFPEVKRSEVTTQAAVEPLRSADCLESTGRDKPLFPLNSAHDSWPHVPVRSLHILHSLWTGMAWKKINPEQEQLCCNTEFPNQLMDCTWKCSEFVLHLYFCYSKQVKNEFLTSWKSEISAMMHFKQDYLQLRMMICGWGLICEINFSILCVLQQMEVLQSQLLSGTEWPFTKLPSPNRMSLPPQSVWVLLSIIL